MPLSYTPTQIANLALDELPSTPIASMSERSYPAQVAARQYPVALAETLESANWTQYRKRQALAQLAINPRAGSPWPYAFALPSDVAMIVRLLPAYDGGALVEGGYFPLAGQTPAAAYDNESGAGVLYDLEGSTLYARESAPLLEYVSTEAPQSMTALFMRALVLRLASKLVMPIKQNRTLRDQLVADADDAARNAAAASFNQGGHRTYGDFLPQDVAARMDLGGSWLD